MTSLNLKLDRYDFTKKGNKPTITGGENKVQLSLLKVLGNPVFSGLPTKIDTLFMT